MYTHVAHLHPRHSLRHYQLPLSRLADSCRAYCYGHKRLSQCSDKREQCHASCAIPVQNQSHVLLSPTQASAQQNHSFAVDKDQQVCRQPNYDTALSMTAACAELCSRTAATMGPMLSKSDCLPSWHAAFCCYILHMTCMLSPEWGSRCTLSSHWTARPPHPASSIWMGVAGEWRR